MTDTAKPPTDSPRIEGKEPIFRSIDDPDMKWQKVRRQKNEDGSEGSVQEKWLAFSADPQYLSLYAVYTPGMVVRRHGHFCPHVVYIIEGGAWFADRWCPAGTHVELPFGAAFGPIVAGDEGCVMLEVMMGDPRSWGDQPERFEQALAAQGAEVLPDVPLDYPDWLQDLRSHWAGSGGAPVENPLVPGREPTFRSLDDPELKWQKCRRQRNRDGSEGTVMEKWFAFSPDPQYLSVHAVYSPGMVVRRHGHFSPHIVYIMEGGAWFGEHWCPKGSHIELPFGAAFGPIVAGDEGATMFEVMMGDPRSWGDQPELFEAALAKQGAEPLPDEPVEYPPWLEDLRTHWLHANS